MDAGPMWNSDPVAPLTRTSSPQSWACTWTRRPAQKSSFTCVLANTVSMEMGFVSNCIKAKFYSHKNDNGTEWFVCLQCFSIIANFDAGHFRVPHWSFQGLSFFFGKNEGPDVRWSLRLRLARTVCPSFFLLAWGVGDAWFADFGNASYFSVFQLYSRSALT